ncbi:phage holin family protein [Hazenella sp. IB182357]|uniref:Phage holin family protein n=1 Tax=Polycladospora coralii TaxID=2771432 RepID=A0A926RUC9_9BACL|nr:phage holin family protein [Polycladospora coralii]MBD1372224.1 phage holin family protein [Polycladospora coralii]MBS7530723.1 phage holin family protein [Polycladospora coralii]
MGYIIKLVVSTLAVLLASQFIPGIEVNTWGTAILAAFVLGIVNLIIRPLLVLLTLPINLVTFGLFTLVINALMFWLTGSLVSGFEVDGFVPAFLGAFVVTIITWIASFVTD